MTERMKQLYLAHERHITTGAFILGFVIDNFTLQRIDLLFENLVLFGYIFVSALSIIVIGVANKKQATTARRSFVQHTAPLTLQFAFGGLFSGFFIFYTRSATLAASWPFLLVLLILLLGNELLKRYYTRLTLQISVFFFALYSFLIFYTPIVLHTMNGWVFLLSGVLSLMVMVLFIKVLSFFIPDQVRRAKYVFGASIGGIFLLVNVLYVTNIIPPIPLSLKDAGVYHNVERVDGRYQVTQEPKPWYAFIQTTNTIHKTDNTPVYVFSSVFAPTDLNVPIIHEWQFYDEVKEEWTTTDELTFTISGGRDGGYRGFSRKRNIPAGTWRVNIKTEQGLLIGRETFKVESTPPVELQTWLF